MKAKASYRYATVSMSLVLFLLGLFALVMLQVQHWVQQLQEELPFLVELRDTATEQEVFQLQQALTHNPLIQASSVRFFSKEEAANLLKEDFGNDFLDDTENPFYRSLQFQMRAEAFGQDSLYLQEVTRLSAHPWVLQVHYQPFITAHFVGNIRQIGYWSLAFGLGFVFIALTLINHTIKLMLYANRFLIKNMELVGATPEFIAAPYLRQGLVNGLLSGLFAVAGLSVLLYLLHQQFPVRSWQGSSLSIGVLFLGLIGLGLFISWWTTRRSVYKYLRMQVDALY